MSLDQLQSILDKNPTIYTYNAEDLIKSPDMVEQKYRYHIETHISLPDLKQYEDRMLNGLCDNKGAFVGGLFGDYGLGKTSTALHLWRVCEEHGLLAVPPYQWVDFDSNFAVVHAWAKYRLSQVNPKLVVDLDQVYDKYKAPSLQKLAMETSKKLGVTYEQAVAHHQDQLQRGLLKLGLSEESYLDFLADVCELVKAAHFKGLIVFHDELQVTVEKLSLGTVADILFRLSASMMDRDGSYGLFVGMPLGTQTALLAERRDIFDRLERQKCFFNLSVAYGSDFPRRLWTEYSSKFGFVSMTDKIVDPDTLDAISQVCDPGRKDLGNGPRSVISAFNRIVDHYRSTGKTYSIEQFVDDCIKGEVVMGQESRYAKNVTETLAKPFIKGKYERLIKILAAFPQGVKANYLGLLGIGKDLDDVVQQAFGEVVYENANGFALVCLQPTHGVGPTKFLESKINAFRRRYAIDPENAKLAVAGFQRLILPHVFSGKEGLHGFSPKGGERTWAWDKKKTHLTTGLVGTFDNALEYPQRLVRLSITEDSTVVVLPEQDEQLSFVFNLQWQNQGKVPMCAVADLAQWVTKFHLDIVDEMPSYSIPLLPPGALPSRLMTPFFLLALAEHLVTQANVPKTEEQDLKFVLDDIIKKVTLHLLGVSHADVKNTDIHLDNYGRRLIADLFWHLCRKRFPDYRTLITQPQWQRKIAEYVKILQLAQVSFTVARGDDPLDLDPEHGAKERRQKVAELFNVSLSTFDTWCAGLKDLVDLSKWREGLLTFRPHPLELEMLEMIQACPEDKKIKVKGKRCQAAAFGEILSHCRALGYTDDEITVVMGPLGQARKFFQSTHVDGVAYVYYEPVSVVELKTELEGKLQALAQKIAAVKLISGFSLEYPVEIVRGEISKIQTNEDAERIRQQVNGHFEKVNRWISKRFALFAADLEGKTKNAQIQTSQFEATGLTGALKQKLDGQAEWISELSQIQTQLAAVYEKYKSEWQSLERKCNHLVAYGEDWASSQMTVDVAKEGDSKLVDYATQLATQQKELQDFLAKFNTIKQHTVAFNRWTKLKVVSDQTWQAVLACQQLGNTAFPGEFEMLAGSIRQHLKKYGRDGLENTEGYEKDLQELQLKVDDYRNGQRRGFLSQRTDFQALLKSIQSPISALRSQFADSNPSGSYDDLYEETWEGFGVVIRELLSSLSQLRNDVEYAATHLGRQQAVDHHGLTSSIHEAKRQAEKLAMSPVTPAGGPSVLAQIATEIIVLRDRYAELLKLYRQDVIRPEEPSADEQEVLALLEKNDKDLKEIILALTAKRNQVELDRILQMMIDLFRKNQLTIKVRKSGA